MISIHLYFKRLLTLIQLILIVLVFSLVSRAAGEVDPTFNAAALIVAGESVEKIIIQTNVKLLVVDLFTQINGAAHRDLARLNADSSLDNLFTANGVNDIICGISLQTDGKILLGGKFTRASRISAVGIARLLNNAAEDTPIPHAFIR